MKLRLVALATAAVVAACSSETPVAPTPATAPSLAKGSGNGGGGNTPAPTPTPTPAPTVSVAGTWTGTYQRNPAPGDTTQWSLNLTQKGDRLEGGLIFIAYANGAVLSVSTSSIRKGTIVENKYIGLEFPKGEGAEVSPRLDATVSDDGRTMVAVHSRYPQFITLTRR